MTTKPDDHHDTRPEDTRPDQRTDQRTNPRPDPRTDQRPLPEARPEDDLALVQKNIKLTTNTINRY